MRDRDRFDGRERVWVGDTGDPSLFRNVTSAPTLEAPILSVCSQVRFVLPS
ncbi:hypothetical protein RRSWK_04168 [Rhodopirellula sp. SWK7]|nr:hypothetical protein RRSWK_04168 [Rhodopirellula sp. SWK7]